MPKNDFLTRMPQVRLFRPDAGFFEKLWGNILFNFGSLPLMPWRRSLSSQDCEKLMHITKAGDIILVSDQKRLGSFFLGFQTAHALIATGDQTAVHAVGDGVVESSLSVICKEYAAYVVVRHNYLPEEDAAEVVARARAALGKPYDFLYNREEREAFFCTELVEDAFEAVHLPLGLKRTWRGIILPTAFLKSQQFTIVGHSSNFS